MTSNTVPAGMPSASPALLPARARTVNSSQANGNGTALVVRVTDSHGVAREFRPAGPHEFALLAAEDARASHEEQALAADELAEISAHGYVLVLRSFGTLIGCAGILLESTDKIKLDKHEARCVGAFVVKEFEGNGHVELLHRAQEKIARRAGKVYITVAERADSLGSLSARLHAGFRVVDYRVPGYDARTRHDAWLFMHKSLKTDNEPFVEDEHRERIAQGLAGRATAQAVAAITGKVDEIAVEFAPPSTNGTGSRSVNGKRSAADAELRTDMTHVAKVLIDAGYVGVGWIQDHVGPKAGAFVYRRRGLPPTRTPGDISVFDEYSPLREVIVNYDSFVADITPEDAINDIAERNIGKVDALAQLDEYRAFVDALQREETRIVRTGAVGTNSRFACFARDSSFVVGDTAFVAHMARRQRQPESDAVSYLFRSTTHVDLRGQDAAYIEGGDIIVEGPNRVIVGLGQRTNDAGADALQAALPDVEIIRVPHAHLHLDVLFTIVGHRIALAYERGLPAEFLEWLDAQRYELVPCDPAEQPTLGCNILAVGDRRVIAVAENVKTNEALASHDVDVIPVKMPNIVMDGGGPRCMACPARRDRSR